MLLRSWEILDLNGETLRRGKRPAEPHLRRLCYRDRQAFAYRAIL